MIILNGVRITRLVTLKVAGRQHHAHLHTFRKGAAHVVVFTVTTRCHAAGGQGYIHRGTRALGALANKLVRLGAEGGRHL